MKAATTTTRTPFTLLDCAHIVGGRIVRVHDNHCPSLRTERPEDCRCAEVEYRLVKAGAQ